MRLFVVSPSAELEERTRVIAALPVCFRPEKLRRDDPARTSRLNLLKAYNRTVAYVRTLRHSTIALTGYTVSQNDAFIGYWVMTQGPTAGKWEKDDIRLLILDFGLSLTDQRLHALLREVRLRIVQTYFFSPDERQEEVWVVAHPLLRQTASAEEIKWLAGKMPPPTELNPPVAPGHGSSSVGSPS